ncbi:hypothetical protein Tco_1391064, partial [Tanacetum coccineum]
IAMVSISVHQEFSDIGKRIEEYDVFSIVYEPVYGIIYTNSKEEKRVMRPSEIHKFCNATFRRTLEGLKSYYNDVKYGYVQKELTNDEVEFLKLFEEEIEVRLNYRDQMRRWEMKGLKRQKEAKTSQKPTKNERDKNKSEGTAKDQSRISPTQQEMKSKVNT